MYLYVHNIDERNFSINYLLVLQNGDSKCRMIECCSRIKEGVLIKKLFSLPKMCCNIKGVV